MAVRAFGYLRVSGASQIDGDGFERQGIAILKHAEANGIEIVEWFEEGGVSGKTEWDSRPAWLKMIQSLNGVQTIVIERLDRLARDLLVQEHILADLKKRGITLISTAEPDLGSEDPTRVLLRQIMGAVAQYDRCMIVNKLRSARERVKAATGRCDGKKPFGFYPEEKSAFSKIDHMNSIGMSPAAITHALNGESVPTRRKGKRRDQPGGPWHSMVVKRIVDRLPVQSLP